MDALAPSLHARVLEDHPPVDKPDRHPMRQRSARLLTQVWRWLVCHTPMKGND